MLPSFSFRANGPEVEIRYMQDKQNASGYGMHEIKYFPRTIHFGKAPIILDRFDKSGVSIFPVSEKENS